MTMTDTDEPAAGDPAPDATPPAAEPAIKGEVIEARAVEQDAEKLPAVPDQRSEVIRQAADMALQQPGIPGRDEFLSLAMTARILSMSGLAPKQVRDNPYVAFHIAMIGRDMQLSPTAALELIDIIGDGDRARPSLSPELMIARVQRLGIGMVKPKLRTATKCIAIAVTIDWEGEIDDNAGTVITERGRILGQTDFGWDDAQIAGLVDTRCTSPTNHSTGCKCKQGWRTYPKRMLWWRAAGYCVDDWFPTASLGLYSPEELGAVVDEQGHAIDPSNVELPEGYDKPPPGSADDDPRADADALWEFQLKINALPEEQRRQLAERWKQSDKLARQRAWALSESRLQYAEALIRGLQAGARTTGWDEEDATLKLLSDLAEVVDAVASMPPGTSSEPPPDTAVEDAPPPDAEPPLEQAPADGTSAQKALTDDLRAAVSPDAPDVPDEVLMTPPSQRTPEQQHMIHQALLGPNADVVLERIRVLEEREGRGHGAPDADGIVRDGFSDLDDEFIRDLDEAFMPDVEGIIDEVRELVEEDLNRQLGERLLPINGPLGARQDRLARRLTRERLWGRTA